MAGKWGGAPLPPPPIHKPTPEQCAATAAMVEEELARYFKGVEDRKRWKRTTKPEARARKAAQDEVRKLRALLREAVEARRYARALWLLEDMPHLAAWPAQEKADKLRDRLERHTRKVYLRAAGGCEVCAAFLADESLDPLYADTCAR